MLEVVSLGEAQRLVADRFPALSRGIETVVLDGAAGRTCAEDIIAEEGVPPFDRSTVDGYAVRASDTFGCSEALPALLALAGEVEMGVDPACSCMEDACVRIPTGGQVPAGADAVVMLEYCEDYGDGTIGVAQSVAPGDNIVFENDDVRPGEVLIPAGTVMRPHHVGTMASLGMTTCAVLEPLRVGIISTGDEIVDVSQVPVASQMRDVNAPTLAAAVRACGAQPVRFDIVPDRFEALLATTTSALETCDMVLVSGGSSAGAKDNTARVLGQLGEMLFHGIALKPGKPTMCADVDGTPVFGLPGHPVAAYLVFLELVRPLLVPDAGMDDAGMASAVLTEGIPSNHGRTEFVAVRLEQGADGTRAVPLRGKSGLISHLSMADGYIAVGRNTEGLAAGATVRVKRFATLATL